MGTDNEKKYDPSYGGSKYRLSYDELGKGKKKRNSISDKTRLLIIFAAVVTLLVAFAVLAVEHYGDELKKIYRLRDSTTESKGEAEFQSSVNIVVD